MKRIQRVFLLCLLGIGTVVFFGRCGDDNGGQGGGGQGGGQGPAKPALGANVVFETTGSTDDGDDGNGPATQYATPARASADNMTAASSTPTTYRDLTVELHAEPGANPVRTAVAFGNTKATSSFNVAARIVCQLVIQSDPTVALNSGRADYLVVARIRRAAPPGQTGPPVQGSDIQARYEFSQNNPNPNMLDIKRQGQANGAMPNGGTIQRIDTSARFTLTPGAYILEFEITGNAIADTDADLSVRAQVTLR